MIERKCEITRPLRYLLRALVNTMLATKPQICEISENDIDGIADLLTRGFVHRSREYWLRGLRRQGTRSLPPDTPRYGYLLENEGVARRLPAHYLFAQNSRRRNNHILQRIKLVR